MKGAQAKPKILSITLSVKQEMAFLDMSFSSGYLFGRD